MSKRKWIIAGLIILAISNWTVFKEYSGINNGYYRYSNLSGTWTLHEIYHQDIYIRKTVLDGTIDLKNLKEKYPGITDTTLHRLFKINPLKFWRWYEYLFDWRYKLPYTNWNSVIRRRNFDTLEHSNNLQQF